MSTIKEKPTRAVLRANIQVAKKVHKKLLKGHTVEKIAHTTNTTVEFVKKIKAHFNI